MKKWYVVHAKPQQEFRAAENLRRQGYEVWLPLLRRTRRHARRFDQVLAPFFPGYLFVSLELGAQMWRSINGTYGVLQILCRDSLPLAVPEGLVETMKSHTDEQGFMPAPASFTEGQMVRVAEGAFEDYIGRLVCLGERDRAALLLNVLGRQVRIDLPQHILEAAV